MMSSADHLLEALHQTISAIYWEVSQLQNQDHDPAKICSVKISLEALDRLSLELQIIIHPGLLMISSLED
jgi:hypothetical protein